MRLFTVRVRLFDFDDFYTDNDGDDDDVVGVRKAYKSGCVHN